MEKHVTVPITDSVIYVEYTILPSLQKSALKLTLGSKIKLFVANTLPEIKTHFDLIGFGTSK